MKNKVSLFGLLSLVLILNPTNVFSQEKGLDERINEAFTPVADWWGAVILHNFPGTEIPTIIFLLVGGAAFFTLYFGFVNFRQFPGHGRRNPSIPSISKLEISHAIPRTLKR